MILNKYCVKIELLLTYMDSNRRGSDRKGAGAEPPREHEGRALVDIYHLLVLKGLRFTTHASQFSITWLAVLCRVVLISYLLSVISYQLFRSCAFLSLISMSRGTRRWCLTINNPEIDCTGCIEKLCTLKVVRAIVGSEFGENGTPHLQGYCVFKNCVRLSGLKKLFPTCHAEFARGSDDDNRRYCSKDGKFETFGEFCDGVQLVSKRKDCPFVLRELLRSEVSDVRNTWPYIRNRESLDTRVHVIRCELHQRRKYFKLRESYLRGWQMHVLRIFMGQNDREILWVYDRTGGVGKSWFGRYLQFVHGADFFDGVTNAAAIAHMLSVNPTYVVFDVTRNDSDHFAYNTLERVKDGFVMSWKWRGHKRYFDPPRVVVLSNIPPKEDGLSADRWVIFDLSKYIEENGDANEETFNPKEEFPPPPCPKVSLEEEEQPESLPGCSSWAVNE